MSLPGAVVRTRRVEGAPVVSVRVWLPGGARSEPIPGLTLVTGRLLTEGAGDRDWRRIADDSEGRGMALIGFGGFEGHGVAFEALAADWELALEWAAEMVLDPTLPQDRLDWGLRQAAAELQSMADRPDVLTGLRFMEHLYHPHPRSRPLQGTAAGLASIGRQECAAFHSRALGRGVLVSVAGWFDPEEVEARVRRLFGDPSGVPAGAPATVVDPEGLEPRRRQLESGGSDQAHVYCGHLTVPRHHSDYRALELLGIILGSGPGLTGRIPMRIREQEGLAYSAHAQTVAGAGRDAGRLAVYLGTSPDSLERAELAVREEIVRLVEEGPTEDEVESARSYLLGRDPFRRETARQWADILIEAEITGLPVDRPEQVAAEIGALDLEGVREAARRHIRPAELRTTVGLPGNQR